MKLKTSVSSLRLNELQRMAESFSFFSCGKDENMGSKYYNASLPNSGL